MAEQRKFGIPMVGLIENKQVADQQVEIICKTENKLDQAQLLWPKLIKNARFKRALYLMLMRQTY